MTEIIIDKRFCGPPNSGNGGYVCGRLARHISGGAEVTLRAPPPLDKSLDAAATADGTWELRDGAKVVATGRAASVELARVETASLQEARAAELLALFKPHEHPLPNCFVCGPARAKGDGLRIFAGPLGRHGHLPFSRRAGRRIQIWPPRMASSRPNFSGPRSIAPPALPAIAISRAAPSTRRRSCSDGCQHGSKPGPAPATRCIITAWPTGRDGRKRMAEAALHDEAGKLLAVASTTWIAVERDVQLGRTSRRVGKGAQRRAHHSYLSAVERHGGHASASALRATADKSLCPPSNHATHPSPHLRPAPIRILLHARGRACDGLPCVKHARQSMAVLKGLLGAVIVVGARNTGTLCNAIGRGDFTVRHAGA